MLRSPLIPCSSASISNIQSHVRQNGLCHRTATKPKSMRSTPPAGRCMIRVCPTARTSSKSPLIRMKTQVQSSKPPTGRPRPRARARRGERPGEGTWWSPWSPPRKVPSLTEHDPGGRDQRQDEHRGERDRDRPYPGHQPREEVDQGDLEAVQRVVEHRDHQTELE